MARYRQFTRITAEQTCKGCTWHREGSNTTAAIAHVQATGHEITRTIIKTTDFYEWGRDNGSDAEDEP